jgi:hypothetical protein
MKHFTYYNKKSMLVVFELAASNLRYGLRPRFYLIPYHFPHLQMASALGNEGRGFLPIARFVSKLRGTIDLIHLIHLIHLLLAFLASLLKLFLNFLSFTVVYLRAW